MNNRGFTLIELIVVMAVFLFIIGAAIGIFISIIQNQKRVLAEEQLLNQISYVEEYMSKALRMASAALDSNCIEQGYIYQLTRWDPAGFYKGIKFKNKSDDNACQEFFLDNTTDPSHPVLKQLKNSSEDADAVPITSAILQINSIRFAVNGPACIPPETCGVSNENDVQPRATMVLNVKFAGDTQQPERVIQTTVSQRNLNVK